MEAAVQLGASGVTLSRVIHGHAAVSPKLMVRLECDGVGTARGAAATASGPRGARLAMQSNFDLARGLDGKDLDIQPLIA